MTATPFLFDEVEEGHVPPPDPEDYRPHTDPDSWDCAGPAVILRNKQCRFAWRWRRKTIEA